MGQDEGILREKRDWSYASFMEIFVQFSKNTVVMEVVIKCIDC